MYACLAVTCHLHFWQNDRDFLRATVVTRGWNGYRNTESQHRKSTLEKKIIPPFQQGFEPATFQSRVRCSNHWAIPAPMFCVDSKSALYISIAKLKSKQLTVMWLIQVSETFAMISAVIRTGKSCQTPGTALRHPFSNHCYSWLRQKSRKKLSGNEQFSDDVQTAVSLLETTQTFLL